MRMLNRIILALEYISDNLGHEHILPAISVLGTVTFILIIGYLMSYLLHLEEEDIQLNKSKRLENSNGKYIMSCIVSWASFRQFLPK